MRLIAKKLLAAVIPLCLLLVAIVSKADDTPSPRVDADPYNDQFIAEKAPLIAFTAARVIDGTGAAARENQTLVISKGRIVAIGPDGSVVVPEGAKQISLKGKSLLPGWVLTHEHLFYGSHPDNLPSSITNMLATQQSISYPRLYLAAGVTSARTAGSLQPYTDIRIKEAIDAGKLQGPDFHLTSPYLSGPNTMLQLNVVESVKEARDTVRYWASQGFTSFKAYYGITPNQLAAVIDEAHKHELKVTADIGGEINTHSKAIELNIDHLEHEIASIDETGESLLPGSEPVKTMMHRYIDSSVEVTSTLGTVDNKQKPEDILAYLTDYSRKEYDQSLHFSQSNDHSAFNSGSLLKEKQALQLAFWRKGGTLTVGTDPAVLGHIAGFGSLRAIELLAEAGIPPIEVIKIATFNGAESLGIANDRGTIEPGKRADLLVIDGNPSVNIKDIYNIETVFKKGIGYDPEALKESVRGTVGGPG